MKIPPGSKQRSVWLTPLQLPYPPSRLAVSQGPLIFSRESQNADNDDPELALFSDDTQRAVIRPLPGSGHVCLPPDESSRAWCRNVATTAKFRKTEFPDARAF